MSNATAYTAHMDLLDSEERRLRKQLAVIETERLQLQDANTSLDTQYHLVVANVDRLQAALHQAKVDSSARYAYADHQIVTLRADLALADDRLAQARVELEGKEKSRAMWENVYRIAHRQKEDARAASAAWKAAARWWRFATLAGAHKMFVNIYRVARILFPWPRKEAR